MHYTGNGPLDIGCIKVTMLLSEDTLSCLDTDMIFKMLKFLPSSPWAVRGGTGTLDFYNFFYWTFLPSSYSLRLLYLYTIYTIRICRVGKGDT